MAKGVYISKSFAVGTVVLTCSAVGAIVVMITLYQLQIQANPPVSPPPLTTSTPIPTGLPPTLRLPTSLVPESYNVALRIHLYVTFPPNVTEQDYDFSGNSTVRFTCVNETWTIFLHAADLMITSINVTHRKTMEEIKVNKWTMHNESDFFEIFLDEQLKSGEQYELFTEFNGTLSDGLTGLYASQYTEKDGGEEDQRFLLASQMQPTDARRVFPCFDEPAFKAIFKISIIHRKKTLALSNGEFERERVVDDSWIITTFKPTPVMSTYLLAFAVTEFHHEKEKYDDKDVSIWARPEAVKAGHTKYAMSITGKLLKFYEDTLNIKYQMNKLDQIALPDFSAGAMENWGLTMYREAALLYEEGVSSSHDKEYAAVVVAHELAHQWLGNLVTMSWWNDLWLSEGFATYLSYLAVNHIEPTWNMNDMFVLKRIQPVMVLDSLNVSHPISMMESEVESTADILGLFDSITYSKGAAVLRMLSEHIGEQRFFKGLHCYLDKYKHSTTNTINLWECMHEQAPDKTIQEMMASWTEQTGYPVLNINTVNGETFQEQFLLKRGEDTGLIWHIPVTYKKTNAHFAEVFNEKGPVSNSRFMIDGDEWLLVNINSAGYYRVNYDEGNWNKLINELNSDHEVIPLINRGQLIDDAFNLARAKYINVRLALNTTTYLKNEREYFPWASALNNLNYFILMFDRSEVYGPMQKYLRHQIQELYTYYENFTNNATVPDSLSDQYNQINAISVACSNGVPQCTEMATKLFDEWKNGTNWIPPNLRPAIYCSAIAAGNEDDWDFAWEQYRNSTIATEKDVLRYALSCTKLVWLLNRYLEYTLDSNMIRKMDAVSTIKYISKNVAGQALAWDFIRAHWTEINQLYGGGMISAGSLIDDVTERFSTEFELQQLKLFQNEINEDGNGPSTRALDQAIERTEANINWVKENKKTVLNWFREQAY